MLTSRTGISLLALTLAGSGLASVLPAPRGEAGQTPSNMLLEHIRPGIFLEQYLAALLGELRQADREADGLDRDDVELAADIRAAQMRASVVSQLLQQDLNGDLVVTRDEVERASHRTADQPGSDVERQLGRHDSDADGRITIQEALAARQERRPDDRLDILLALDPSGDRVTTARELRALAEKAFAGVDSDGDDRISQEEYRRIVSQIEAIRADRMAPVCGLGEVPSNARLIVFGTYEADAVSSAAIGGPDQETNLIDVVIEPGSQPLYLVLTSYESMVWRVVGDTRRIARVVVTSSQAAANGASASGVIGVPARKVTVSEPNCPRYFSERGSGSVQTVAAVKRALGRDPDGVFATYSAQRISLPSGRIDKARRGAAPLPRGFDAEMWREASRFWEAGLIAINHRTIVAAARVEPYKVYPSQIGLAQLLGSGAMVRTADGRFRLVRPIPHMPPSMGGAHSIELTIAKGVPLPPGDPVHTCVTMEGSGESLGPACRKER